MDQPCMNTTPSIDENVTQAKKINHHDRNLIAEWQNLQQRNLSTLHSAGQSSYRMP